MLNRIMEYLEKKDFFFDYYPGISEMGYDDKPAIAGNWNQVKDKFYSWLEEQEDNFLTLWSDEWHGCSNCNKAVRMQPDSWGWQPSWIWVSDCEIICRHCGKDFASDIVERNKNEKDEILPKWCVGIIEKEGFKVFEHEEFDRFKAVKLVPKGFDYLITDKNDEPNFEIYTRKEDYENED